MVTKKIINIHHLKANRIISYCTSWQRLTDLTCPSHRVHRSINLKILPTSPFYYFSFSLFQSGLVFWFRWKLSFRVYFLLPPSLYPYVLSPRADNSYHLTVLLHHTERINAAFNPKLLMVLFAVPWINQMKGYGMNEKFSLRFAKKVKSLSAFVRISRVPVSGFLGFLLPFSMNNWNSSNYE